MKHERLAVITFLAFLCVPCLAQELDIFELTDFVDPRLRGCETEDLKVTNFGTNYQFVRAIFGGVTNYTTRTQVTNSDMGFVHLAGSFYAGMNQINLRVTTIQERNAGTRPLIRVTGQFARYSFSYLDDPETGKRDEIADRYLVTASAEEREICSSSPTIATPGRASHENVTFSAGTTCGRHVDSEVAIQSNSSITPRADSDFVAFTLGVHRTFEDGMVFRGTIGYRFFQHDFHRNRFSVGFDHSLENGAGSWHIGATRLAIGYSHLIMKGVSIHGVWQPSYVPREPGHHVNQEFGIFFDTTLFARVFPGRQK